MKLRIGCVLVGILWFVLSLAARTSGNSPASTQVPPSGTLSANHILCLSILCVSAARWYGQRRAYNYSLQQIWTADE
jgi:hypothetical protein